jgi:hypothetical protein
MSDIDAGMFVCLYSVVSFGLQSYSTRRMGQIYGGEISYSRYVRIQTHFHLGSACVSLLYCSSVPGLPLVPGHDTLGEHGLHVFIILLKAINRAYLA